MPRSDALVRWLLPWTAVLFASTTFVCLTMNSAIAGGSRVQEPCAVTSGTPMSVGIDWWIVAADQRKACAH